MPNFYRDRDDLKDVDRDVRDCKERDISVVAHCKELAGLWSFCHTHIYSVRAESNDKEDIDLSGTVTRTRT